MSRLGPTTQVIWSADEHNLLSHAGADGIAAAHGSDRRHADEEEARGAEAEARDAVPVTSREQQEQARAAGARWREVA